MSEYWKSTPKYWCKHCKTYVRDTKLEKQQHEATPKHQGNLKRFLRDLHRGHEREERDKDRAKHEVERLNAVVSGVRPAAAGSSTGAGSSRGPAQPSKPPVRQATAEERKRQLAQLADMGVAIPDQYRPEMAMTGEWQTVSQKVIYPVKSEEDSDEDKHRSSVASHSLGIRKRKMDPDDDEDEEETAEAEAEDGVTRRPGWGSSVKRYPTTEPKQDDLEALLARSKARTAPVLENGPSTAASADVIDNKDGHDMDDRSKPHIKHENSESDRSNAGVAANTATAEANAPVVFKKRKTKAIRQQG